MDCNFLIPSDKFAKLSSNATSLSVLGDLAVTSTSALKFAMAVFSPISLLQAEGARAPAIARNMAILIFPFVVFHIVGWMNTNKAVPWQASAEHLIFSGY